MGGENEKVADSGDGGKTRVYLPAVYRVDARVLGSPVRQLLLEEGPADGIATSFTRGKLVGTSIVLANHPLTDPILILPKTTTAKGLPEYVLCSPNDIPSGSAAAEDCKWLKPKPVPVPDAGSAGETFCETIRSSWIGAFSFKQERRDGDAVVSVGLRPPQIGALHAVLSHWTVSEGPATVVMPTGTGKTETMLALLVAEALHRVLVIVPTDPLRDQIGGKFESLGILRPAGVVASTAELPVVGKLLHKPKTAAEVDELFSRCNVVVTTASIAGDCTNEVLERIAFVCSHLFVDEAHHVRASTWERVRDAFARKRVVQFTATPYRGDKKLVDGKVVYNYPLKKAQQEGYFRTIRFRPVEEYNEADSDREIAAVAIAQLDADLKAGYDHLLMARVDNIDQAAELYSLYLELATHHHPVIAHSKQTPQETRGAVTALKSRQSRIVVCVSMFGEGFDLPELKVAALHEVHKSLGITLQFTGRFTRTKSTVGDATIVANIANAEVEEALEALYAEDRDWNELLRDLSEGASEGHGQRTEFDLGFTDLPERIPIQNIFPKMSTVVFRTSCASWWPHRAKKVLKHLYDKPAVSLKAGQVVTLMWQEQGRLLGFSLRHPNCMTL